jgi:hypothetical protein
MNKENEVWGVMTKEEFERKLKEFTLKFGEPKLSRRMAIQVLDLDNTSLWTRIRITDGKVELMQKVGKWDIGRQEEISLKLEPDAENIHNLYKILRNLLQKGRIEAIIIQHENYIFNLPDVEIKLSRQFGKSDKFSFEIQAKTDKVNLIKIANELSLKPYVSNKGEEFWTKWNKEVNLDALKMTEKEIKNIIKRYLGGE